MQIIFGRLCGFNQSVLDLTQVLSQVPLQFCVLGMDSVGSAEDRLGREDSNMAVIIFSGTDNRSV